MLLAGSPHLHAITRRKLAEQSSNLAAAPVNGGAQLGNITPQPISRSSGSFPAVPGKKGKSPDQSPSPSGDPKQHSKSNPGAPQQTDNQDSGKFGISWKFIVGILCGVFLLIIAVVIICICRSRAARTIGPWKTGLSGQLQKAFVTGDSK